ncbi:MAG: orotate phosphoribosyltransferase [Rhizobiales bacterium]|nr:orotate phosphoribosyltransferase [Hyphomicrobiales bacterium]
MSEEDVLDEFRAAGALLEGHFVLTSGLHSPRYLQCARVMMDARRGELLCAELAGKIDADVRNEIDLVVSPAMGGIIVGHEMGRQLGVPAIFVERVEGVFTLRRGFAIEKGARCLMVEDIVTTGLSSRETIDTVTRLGGNVVAAACLIDRSSGAADLGVPLSALARIDIPTFAADDLPEWLAAVPAEKPGSRKSV